MLETKYVLCKLNIRIWSHDVDRVSADESQKVTLQSSWQIVHWKIKIKIEMNVFKIKITYS